MSTDDMIKLGVGVVTALGMFGAGSFAAPTVESSAVEGWCGEALAIQASHYREEIEDLEEEMEGLEDECAGPN